MVAVPTLCSCAILQLLVALADGISTKGTKSGTFVMYNCARLATLFEGYKRSVEQGLYPAFPPVSSLDFSLLREEVSAPLSSSAARRLRQALSAAFSQQGEWLLLFNGVLPFPDLLRQAAALDLTAPGLHMAAHTEMVRQERLGQTPRTLYSGLGCKGRETGQ